MQVLTARDRGPRGYVLCVHLVPERLIPDPSLPPPVLIPDPSLLPPRKGEREYRPLVPAEDIRPLVPDPAWCLERTWPAFVPGRKAHGGPDAPEVTQEMYEAQILEEIDRLAKHELAQRTPVAEGAPEERVLAVEGKAL